MNVRATYELVAWRKRLRVELTKLNCTAEFPFLAGAVDFTALKSELFALLDSVYWHGANHRDTINKLLSECQGLLMGNTKTQFIAGQVLLRALCKTFPNERGPTPGSFRMISRWGGYQLVALEPAGALDVQKVIPFAAGSPQDAFDLVLDVYLNRDEGDYNWKFQRLLRYDERPMVPKYAEDLTEEFLAFAGGMVSPA